MPNDLMNISNTGPIKKALAEPLSLLTAETRACLVHALVLAWAALVFRCSPGRVVRAEVTQLSYHYSPSFTRLMIWTEFPLLGGGSLLLADGPCAIHFPFCWDVSQNHSKPSIPVLAFFWEGIYVESVEAMSYSLEPIQGWELRAGCISKLF